MGDFWTNFPKFKMGQILMAFNVSGLKKLLFLLQKTCPCANPRCLSHFMFLYF